MGMRLFPWAKVRQPAKPAATPKKAAPKVEGAAKKAAPKAKGAAKKKAAPKAKDAKS